MGEYKTGLWKKISKKGNSFYSGKIKIGTTDYNVVLFVNENKQSEKSPDYNIILKDALIVPGEQKQVKIVPKNESSNGLDDELFEQFGNSIEIDPDEIAL